jgi:formylglycine-generating enzyme required for sulfatase activity
MYRILLVFLVFFSNQVFAVEKKALIIGNGDYFGKWQLSNPANDAEDIAKELGSVGLGFKVTVLINKNKREMSDAIQTFSRELKNGDVVVFYFSGHGFSGKNLEDKETNFLVGNFKDEPKTRAVLEEESIDANFVVKSLRQSNKNGINIMILDACRNIPRNFVEEQKGEFEEGLVSLGKYERFIMNYATQPLKKALGSKNSRNSLYTQYLVEGLKNPQLTSKNITEFFNEVSLKMAEQFGDKQTPLVEAPPVKFCLAGCQSNVVDPQIQAREKELAEREKQLKEKEAKLALATPPVEKPSGMSGMSGMSEKKTTPKVGETFKDCPDCPEMIVLKGGSFKMGSEKGEDDEKPVHEVNIKPFAIGKFEVTVEQYLKCVAEGSCNQPEWLESGSKYNINTGSSDLYKKVGMSENNGNHAIVGVSWNDATKYAEWLSKKTAKKYRLPTEAEWEYAARANTSTKWSFGDNESDLKEYAWYTANSDSKTYEVGQKKPNGFGLFDMHGNVWELTCSDKENYSKNKHLECSSKNDADKSLRGGSWCYFADFCRSAFRSYSSPDNRYDDVGFRVVSVFSL